MLGVAVIEEAAKLIVPFLVLLILPNSDRQAGVMIGIASGAGSATLETMGYGATAAPLPRARTRFAVGS